MTREWRNRHWQRQAQEANNATAERNSASLLKQTIFRTLAIALLVILLALSLTTIARAL